MISFLLERARAAGLERVFTLTTQAADWFEKLGFIETDPSALPKKRLETFNERRRSLVFYKPLH
jgi:amino-acid N-acetyltransferase